MTAFDELKQCLEFFRKYGASNEDVENSITAKELKRRIKKGERFDLMDCKQIFESEY